jgi:hypothetical protein
MANCYDLQSLEKKINELNDVLKETDSIMVRAIEDLINLLIEKQVISYEELHPNIFKNINIRRGIRSSIQGLSEIKNRLAEGCAKCKGGTYDKQD